jgi:hypothetical protein
MCNSPHVDVPLIVASGVEALFVFRSKAPKLLLIGRGFRYSGGPTDLAT